MRAFLLADACSGMFVLVIVSGMFCVTQLRLQKAEHQAQQSLVLEQKLLYESGRLAQKLSQKDQKRKVELVVEMHQQKSSFKYLPKN